MRVCDAQNSVYNGLCGMEWYRYLRAMWMIGGELLQIYDDRISDPERSLIMATLDLVRSVAESENVPTESSGRARDLDTEWERVIDEADGKVTSGQWNMQMVFGMLASEVAGDVPPHFAAERVNLALTKRFRERLRTDGRPNIRVLDPVEEIDDESPMALTLGRARRIVTGAARVPTAMRDPAAVRDQVFAT